MLTDMGCQPSAVHDGVVSSQASHCAQEFEPVDYKAKLIREAKQAGLVGDLEYPAFVSTVSAALYVILVALTRWAVDVVASSPS
jgi:hypothetical protein